MKNILLIDSEGEKLVSSINDGTNRLFINDNEIDSSNWVGNGNYTATIEEHTITIAKAPNLNGNYELIKVSDYNYKFARNKSEREQLIDLIYPVGSIYMSVNAVDPGTMFDGTEWEQITGKFLLAAGNGYNNGATGGEATHVLTPSETAMKNHSHTMAHTHTLNSHTHNITGGTNRWVPTIVDANNVGHNIVLTNIADTGSGVKVMALSGDLYSKDGITVGEYQTTGGNNTNTSASSAANTGGQTESNGSAHNNMPPYLAVNIWKRIS